MQLNDRDVESRPSESPATVWRQATALGLFLAESARAPDDDWPAQAHTAGVDKIKCGLDERASRLRWLATRDDADLRSWLYHWKLAMMARALSVGGTATAGAGSTMAPDRTTTAKVQGKATSVPNDADGEPTGAWH